MKTILFVDDEARILRGMQRQLHAMRNEWSMHFLESGKQALEFMALTPVDVVVTDMIMPGMDGAELLDQIVRRHPETVRFVLSGHSDQAGIMRLVGPAHQYLSKPCKSDDLRAAISRAFALREMLSSRRLQELTASTGALPVIPAIYTQLTAELGHEEPSLQRIASIISKDLGLVSKMLQLVNSAFFGLPRGVNTVQEAVSFLGLATINSLVLALQVFQQFQDCGTHGFSINALTDHCSTTGMLAKRIAQAQQCDSVMVDYCFIAGFLHDIGQLILAIGLPAEFGAVLEAARAQGAALSEIEQTTFGANHAIIGGYLLGLWGMPNPVVEAVSLHHCPQMAAAKGFSPVLAVHFADAFAHDLAGNHGDWPGNRMDPTVLEKFGLQDRLEVWREICREPFAEPAAAAAF